MDDIKKIVIWLVLLSVMVFLLLMYLIFLPNINVYIAPGNYTFDIGDNFGKLYNASMVN